jgi:hypothetical protein
VLREAIWGLWARSHVSRITQGDGGNDA